MEILTISLIISTLLCGLTAGLIFGFSVVIMPGIKNLNDGEFIRAFQKMDAIIQNNQPLFMLVWVGSVLVVIASLILGVQSLAGIDFLLLITSSTIYFLGVQLPTATINVPLNNTLQKVQTKALNNDELESARSAFEDRWNRWNSIRTVFAVISVILFLVLLTRI